MKKICLRCQREYTADGVNFCFDDGEPLHQALTSESRVCPKCETRYGMGATQCARDLVPLVRPGDVAAARQRICSDCGRAAPDNGAEFCGHDGARVLARWEVGLVTRTAVPGELEAHDDSGRKTLPDRPTTRPGGPGVSRAQDGPAQTSGPRPAMAMPAVKGLPPVEVSIVPAPEAPAKATSQDDASAEKPPRAGTRVKAGGRETPGQSGTGWFVGASGVGNKSLVKSRSLRLGAGFDADADAFGPTQVSRKLIAVTIVSALLCGGAFAFSRYAATQAARRATTNARTTAAPDGVMPVAKNGAAATTAPTTAPAARSWSRTPSGEPTRTAPRRRRRSSWRSPGDGSSWRTAGRLW